jgi:hypothetical protein
MFGLDMDRLTTAERDAVETVRWHEGDNVIEETVEGLIVTVAVLRSWGRSDESITQELMGYGHDFRHEYDPAIYLTYRAILKQAMERSETLS